MKILKYTRIQIESVPGSRALMTLKFLDSQGDLYSWAPKWEELEKAFLQSLNVEGFNKPESEWLNRFANTVKEVAEGVSQPIQNARKVAGRLEVVEEGKLQVSVRGAWDDYSLEYITPGFAIDYAFLDEWLGQEVEALVINGIVVHLRQKRPPYVRYPEFDMVS